MTFSSRADAFPALLGQGNPVDHNTRKDLASELAFRRKRATAGRRHQPWGVWAAMPGDSTSSARFGG